jgi:hypothetical protein
MNYDWMLEQARKELARELTASNKTEYTRAYLIEKPIKKPEEKKDEKKK